MLACQGPHLFLLSAFYSDGSVFDIEFIRKALITMSVRPLAHNDSRIFKKILIQFRIVTLYVKFSTQTQFVLKSYSHYGYFA
jgi:hypothetical protein